MKRDSKENEASAAGGLLKRPSRPAAFFAAAFFGPISWKYEMTSEAGNIGGPVQLNTLQM
jgi:hypothetical protein